LAGYLEENRPEQIHWREVIQPGVRIEIGVQLDEPSDDRICSAEVVLGASKLLPPASGGRSGRNVGLDRRSRVRCRLPHRTEGLS
jgi:hypothetical protein